MGKRRAREGREKGMGRTVDNFFPGIDTIFYLTALLHLLNKK
jgi:hypothetical protein